MKTLTIRVSDEEHAMMVAAAAKRFMTITGMVRAHFHALAAQDGALQKEPPQAQSIPTPVQAKPQVRHTVVADEVTPKPQPEEEFLPNKWAHLPEPNLDEDSPFA